MHALTRLCLLLALSTPALGQNAQPYYVGAEGFTPPVSPVVYAEGLYAVADASGSVYFSSDAQTWDQIYWDTAGPLRWVRHDGERWVVATKDGQISFSQDRRVWSPFFKSGAASEDAVLWRGRYWQSFSKTLGLTYRDYRHGRYDGGVDAAAREWDWQLLKPNYPSTFWVQDGRLHTLREDGLNFVTDNGDYWGINRGAAVPNAREVFVAVGNGLTVSFIVPEINSGNHLKPSQAGEMVAFLQEGDAFAEKIETPFKSVAGLAYGAGRFVAAASETSLSETALYESIDGREWKQISEKDRQLKNVIYGAAGFVASGRDDKRVMYAPAPLPEKPMPAAEPVPVPHYAFVDVGSNFVGVGKKRKELPMTPAQQKVADLTPRFQEAYAGDVAARVEMAHLEVEGEWIASNPWRSELYFKAGIEAGIASAARGYAELLSKWKPATPRADIEALYRQSAGLGDSPAAVWLALNLDAASPAARNEIERWRDVALAADADFAARFAIREQLDAQLPAARRGDIAAITAVLPILLEGKARPTDWTGAAELARLAAVAGDFAPAIQLIQHYQVRFMGAASSSPEEAGAAYRSLVDYGVEVGKKEFIGLIVDHLLQGRFGYPVDHPRALEIAKDAAAGGDADLLFLTAVIYLEGNFKVKDAAAAAEWMRKAADAGQVNAKQWLQQQQP